MAKLEKFKLTDQDPNITADSTFGTTWRDTWKYQCPPKWILHLQKGQRFSLKAYDSSDVEYVAPDAQVKIEVRGPVGQNIINIYGPANYLSSDDFQDEKKVALLNLDQEVIVKPRDLLVFMTKDSTGMDAASILTSFASLTTLREKV